MMNLKVLFLAVMAGLVVAFTFSLVSVTGFGLMYYQTWFEVMIGMGLFAFIYIIIIQNKDSSSYGKNKRTFEKSGSILIAIALIFIGTTITKIVSSKMFNASAYVESVEVKDSNLSYFQTDSKNIRQVTLAMANTLANKIIGQKVNGIQLSSQYQLNLNMASVQQVNGEMIWVIPLDYAGFTKWMSQDSIPGYVTMSATDPKAEPKLILGKKIIVSDNGYFGDNINRKIWWKSGFKSSITHMEIDDKGNVFWISPILTPSIGFSLDTVTAVIVMNAETLEYSELSIQDTMKKYPWIDRIWPEEIIKERLEAYGSLQNGWLNTIFGETNVNKPTSYDGAELWMINVGGKLQWFSGMTSVQSDKSLVSGILIEANGGEKPILREIPLSGITDENGAVDAINGGLGAAAGKWKAVLPQPVMVKGKFYWHASIVSENNMYQKSGLVQGDDMSNVFYGSTLFDAINSISYGEQVTVTSTNDNNSDAIIAKIIIKIDELEELKKALILSKNMDNAHHRH
jgi:hypothetical protein